MKDQLHCDVVIIGGGIAGASLGYEISKNASVIVLEMEPQPGFHTTGRSAAVFIPSYCHDEEAIYELSTCSYPTFKSPDPDFCAVPLLSPRGGMYITEAESLSRLRKVHERRQKLGVPGEWLEAEAVKEKVPELAEEYSQGAIYEAAVADIDVNALHESYLRGLRNSGGEVICNAGVTSINRSEQVWSVNTDSVVVNSSIIVNAAGAWADQIATLASVSPVGLEPKRRTAIMIDPPEHVEIQNWPIVAHVAEAFYLKPDAGKLMVSPSDETLSPPCDAQPEELDIAYAAHYAEQALGQPVPDVTHKWAGLRTFAPDRNPVIGFAPDADGFFWFAGQGGFGIQTAPAAARLGRALLFGEPIPEDLAAAGFNIDTVTPQRLLFRG